MTRAKISELKDRLSYYLKRVRQGEEIEVIDRNIPIALIVPIRPAAKDHQGAWLERLRRSGVVRVGTMKPVKEILERKPSGKSSGVLAALLEERRTGR